MDQVCFAMRLSLVAGLTVLLSAMPPPGGTMSALANSGSTNQSVRATVTGTLSISMSQANIDFGSVAQQQSAGPVSAGTITYTNTLNDGMGWSVSVAATDMFQGMAVPSSCSPAAACIPFTAEQFGNGAMTPGSITGQNGASTSGMTNGCTGALAPFPSGPDSSPGASYSPPLNVMSGATGTDQGTYAQTGCNAGLQVPSGTTVGTYSSNYQYTITG